MSHTQTEQEIMALSRTVAARMGLHFPVRRHADLWRGVEAAAHDLGFEDAPSCARWLSSNRLTRKHIEILASYLTIGETYFFREHATLDALRDTVLPELIASRRDTDRRIRIWSAGCCTGEEPYSVAMILNGLIPDLSDWDIVLLATDINPLFLHRAGEGLYRPWSFRSCPPLQKKRYFHPAGAGLYKLSDAIRHMVTFEYLNLAVDHYPSLLNNTNAMDIILCRNVLMYFEPSVAAGIVARLGRCLVDGGRLVVSPSETFLVTGERFQPERNDLASLYRRVRPRAARVPHAGREPSAPARACRCRPAVMTAISSARPRPQPHPGTGTTALLAASYREAEALYKGGRYPEVVSMLLPHVKSGMRPYNARQWGALLRMIARAYANHGMLDEAEHWCRQALQSSPNDPGCHYLLATILQEEGHLGEARELLQSTVQLDPCFVLAHFALGALCLHEGHNRRASRHFEGAIGLLEKVPPQVPVPESEGIPAGRLIEIIRDQQQGVVVE